MSVCILTVGIHEDYYRCLPGDRTHVAMIAIRPMAFNIDKREEKFKKNKKK
jgi:hypothetical protein